MNRKWISITVALALTLIVFLYGKENGWWKKKASTGGEDVLPDETPTVSVGVGTPPMAPGNTGTGTKPAPKTKTPKPIGKGTGSGIPSAKFNADEQARNIYKLLSSWFDSDDEDEKAFDILLDYNEVEMRAVNKRWNEVFLGGRTMYAYVDSEVVRGRATVLDKKLEVLKRMKNLGLHIRQ